jgi:hypothetical protein
MRKLDVKLSTFAPTVIPRAQGSGEQTDNFTFSLAPGETERFALWIEPTEYEHEVECYEWVAWLDLLVNNKRDVVKIWDEGKPFVLYRGIERAHHWEHGAWKAQS